MAPEKHFGLVIALALAGCTSTGYRYREPFPQIDRNRATPASIAQMFGPPAKVSIASGKSKEGPPVDLAYRYYFATRDGYPSAKIFCFYQGKWTGENVLGGERREEFFRLLNPAEKTSTKSVKEWEAAHPYVF